MGYIGSKPANKVITASDLEDDIITSAKIADGVIVAGDLAANSVDSSELVDGSIDTSHLSADAVDGTKLADDAVNSEHYTDGSIDTAHIGASQVTDAKIADMSATKLTGSIADARVPASAVTQHVTAFDDNQIQNNIALLGFKTAVNGSLAKYSLVDQIVDEFVDSTGIDTSASLNENRTGGYVKGEATTATPVNYWGSGGDGALTTSGNVTHTVQNKSGSYDGDMLVKNYSSLNIQSGHTMTVDQPCRGMMIFVDGDCTIAGTLHMNSKGAFANPTSSGGSDSNAVQSAGLQIGFRTASGSTSLTNANTNFNGCGTAARTAIANFANTSSNGTTITIPRQGDAGANGPSTADSTTPGSNASNASTTGATGGGGSGAGAYTNGAGTPANGRIGDGSYGSCFVGGSGGGSAGGSAGRSNAHMDGTHAAAWGGAGGYGTGSTGHGNFGVTGGAGNPTGDGWCAGGSCSASDYVGTGINGYGGGGLIWLIVKGDLTVTGTISANGASPNGESSAPNGGSGGGSGGGTIVYAYGGTLSNSGTIQANGGAGLDGGAGYEPGNGGNGSVQALAAQATVDTVVEGGALTLISTATTAEATATKGNLVCLIENVSGTATVNTDIKGWVSANNGTNYTQGTLVDEGTWGTNKKILAFHDATISNSGTSMRYKVTLHNQSNGSKVQRVHAVSMGWK